MSLNTNTLPTASDLSSEKRSVCLINDSFPPVIDGVANAVTNYASIIQRNYGDATVVTPYYPDADDSIYPFPVLRYPSIDVTKLVGYRAGLPLSPELMAQVEGRHIDLIHSHCPVTSTILARMLRQRLHVPLVFTYHTKFDIDIANAIHSKRLQEASIKLLVENISACDEVWTVSRGAGENLRSLGYQGDYIVMPNGVDIPADRLPDETVRAVSEGLDLPEGVPLLLFVGRMMWYKGLRIILDALKQLKGEGQDFRMVFIGKGTDGEAIRAYAEELCLGDNRNPIARRAFDTHDVGYQRGGVAAALQRITAECLVVGISTDIIFTVPEMQALHRMLPRSTYHQIDSPFGHDGFLVEHEQLNRILNPFIHPTHE